MTVHGVAGYMSGCRCEQCFTAQRQRERQLAAASDARWAAVVRQADLAESRMGMKQSPGLRGPQADERQRIVELAELELRRQQQSLRRQRKTTRKQETARQRTQAVREMQERYAQAVAERDFQWLLAAERRAMSSLRTRISRLVSADGRRDCYELLWRQALQARELTEVHYHELSHSFGGEAGGAVMPQGGR